MSGLSRTPGKRVRVHSPSGVRIPLSPPDPLCRSIGPAPYPHFYPRSSARLSVTAHASERACCRQPLFGVSKRPPRAGPCDRASEIGGTSRKIYCRCARRWKLTQLPVTLSSTLIAPLETNRDRVEGRSTAFCTPTQRWNCWLATTSTGLPTRWARRCVCWSNTTSN
jgi:hypothetical protein